MARALTHLDHLAKAARTASREGGDPGATERFLLALYQHLEEMTARLVRRAGYRGVTEADRNDLVHEILLQLWQEDLPEWRETRGSFLSFARMRVRWSLASFVRTAARFIDRPAEGDDALELACDSDPETLLADVAAERRLAMLEHLVDKKLPPVSRALVRRVDLREEPLSRVARHKKLHVSRACRLRQEAHRQLAAALAA